MEEMVSLSFPASGGCPRSLPHIPTSASIIPNRSLTLTPHLFPIKTLMISLGQPRICAEQNEGGKRLNSVSESHQPGEFLFSSLGICEKLELVSASGKVKWIRPSFWKQTV